jgi:ubiquinone/menaquinone biosynthesis C-methylase UbiE
MSELRESIDQEGLVDYWNKSTVYRDCGKAIGLEESVFRKDLTVTLGNAHRVLDLACGDGNNLPYLPAGIEYVGCDFSQMALDRLMARTDHPPMNKQVHAGDITKLPVPDASQDAVISSYSFEHFIGVPAILDECDRVLAPGGLFVIFGPDFSHLNSYGPPQQGREARNRPSLYFYAIRRLLRRLRYGVGKSRVLFEYIEPLPLDDTTFAPDHDMTHLTKHSMVAKYMAAKGYESVGLTTTHEPSRSALRRMLERKEVWGQHGDSRLVMRKPAHRVASWPVRVTERLISRQQS